MPSITGFFITAALVTKATEIENKISDITNLAIKATRNTKATENENKILDTTSFTTNSKFNGFKNLKMKEAVKTLASKSQVDSAIDIADKNRINL